jgi:hypothetical protein
VTGDFELSRRLTKGSSHLRGMRELARLRQRIVGGAANGSETAHGMRFSAERLPDDDVRFVVATRASGDWDLYARRFFGCEEFVEVAGGDPLRGVFIGRISASG